MANSSASLTYGGANQVSGVIVKDTIQLGGVKISDQDIIVVDKVNREFGENKACDGFLGLGLGNDPLISGRDGEFGDREQFSCFIGKGLIAYSRSAPTASQKPSAKTHRHA